MSAVMLTLYHTPGSCSFASHVVLEELGLPFGTVVLDLMAGDQRQPGFLAINPQGKVPALLTGSGVLTESPAILSWLADQKPQMALLPHDVFERARCASSMAWLSSTVHIAFARYWRGAMFTDEVSAWGGLKDRAQSDIEAAFTLLDQRLDGQEWLHGGYTVVDPYVLVMRRWGSRIGLDMGRWPNLLAHGDRVAARPAARRAIARDGIRIDG
jgi:glutathione S-transferase